MRPETPQLVVALDSHDTAHILRLAASLRGIAPWVKIGLELFVHAGPNMITRLKDMGFKVFLDLKMFDIPNTVRGGVLAAVDAGADMLTVHTLGGERMIHAALEAAGTDGPIVMGITVLTSMSPGELPCYGDNLGALAVDLAERAQRWGLHGVVCSGHEVRMIHEHCGRDFFCLTPGIRPAAPEGTIASADDQRRIMTPAAAVLAGATFLVAGRPITAAPNPAEAAIKIIQEIQRTAA